MSASTPEPSDDTLVFINGNEIRDSSFQHNFIQGMVTDAQRILRDKLLFASSLPDVPLLRIQDDMNNNTNGYSFVTDLRNAALFSRGFSNLHSRNVAAEDLPDYISHVNSFLELLLMLFLTTGGQPPHSHDLTSLLLVNAQSYTRSFFIMSEECRPKDHGNVAIVTRTLDEQLVHRALPPNVSTLLVLYLVDVLPFLRCRQLTPAAGQEALICNSLLFSDGWTHWSQAKYEGILKRETRKRIGVAISLAGYRTVYMASERRFMPGSMDGVD